MIAYKPIIYTWLNITIQPDKCRWPVLINRCKSNAIRLGLPLLALLSALWLFPHIARAGEPSFEAEQYFGIPQDGTRNVAVGDVDGDGDLDIIAGNDGTRSAVYVNNGKGHFDNQPDHVRRFGTEQDGTRSVAVGDVDGDGDLDIIAGNDGTRSAVYLNDGAGHFDDQPDHVRRFGTVQDDTASVAVGDLDGDGDLDIILSNDDTRSAVYLNDGAGHFDNQPDHVRRFGAVHDRTRDVAVGDVDGDGDLDLIVGNVYATDVVYLNDGAGHFDDQPDHVRRFGAAKDLAVAVGDVDRDGDLDFILGNSRVVYLNTLRQTHGLTNNAPLIVVTRPITTANANFLSSPTLLISSTIPITYTLFDPEGEQVGQVKAWYSLDGGSNWRPAVATTNTITTNLTTERWVVSANQKPRPMSLATHVFNWDTLASGFFGQSDNVVIRMAAYAQPITTTVTPTGTYHYTNSTGGSYQWPYVSSTTFPFRARGTQVQVYSDTITATAVVSNAIVYRLPKEATHGAQPLADASGHPFVTDGQGYLQGRGEIAPDDHLVALLPITHTNNYTLYYTSATPAVTGLDMFTVTHARVQTLVVSKQHPLLLFNLTVALEWDARNDEPYQNQLRAYLQRASELLYTWTNGQAALGNLTIYDNRQHWNEANIRILASNRLRPNSDQGGIIASTLTETVPISRNGIMTNTTLIYQSGQVHMPVLWNRFGAADSSSLGEDWPRTLAHELGHYLFFLYDNYLGFDAKGKFVAVSEADCPGVMTDPYRDDHFVITTDWPKGKRPDNRPDNKPGCENTSSNRLAGRADWRAIASHYPVITPTMTYTGPNTLPLAVTHIAFAPPITPTASAAFAVPIYTLLDQTKPYFPSGQARAFLLGQDRLIDLGRPTGDQIKAWGASPNHTLCLFDPPQHYAGCKALTSSDSELHVQHDATWQPDVTVHPLSLRTFQVNVTGINPHGSALHARLYPANAISAITEITLTQLSGDSDYVGEFANIPTDTHEAYIYVWAGDQPTEAFAQFVTDFSIGGNPVDTVAGGMRCSYIPPSGLICYGSPVLSGDGQAMLLGTQVDLGPGQFYAIQTASQVPSPPPWATIVGQAYSLITSSGAPTLTNASLSLSYLSSELASGEKLTIYFYDQNSPFYDTNLPYTAWRPLPTTLQPEVNSAIASITQPGLYVLMASLEVPLAGRGWNLIGYPVQESRPVTVALQSINGQYQTVYGYDATDPNDPWKIYDRNLPSTFNDLTRLDFGKGYWVNITDTLVTTPTLQLKGTSSLTTTRQAPRAVALNLLYPPPATYYGELDEASGFTTGMTITASIGDVICGMARTQKIEGKLMYLIKVSATIPGDNQKIRCGAPGRIVTFSGISRKPVTLPWDNNQVQVLKPDQ